MASFWLAEYFLTACVNKIRIHVGYDLKIDENANKVYEDKPKYINVDREKLGAKGPK